MGKKSGKAGRAVPPAEPDKAVEAAVADPGEAAKKKAGQQQNDAETKPHKPPPEDEEEEQQQKKSWIEIELVGEDDEPIPGERYRITLPDNSVASGTLDEKGFARVEGFEKGTCKICFPGLDKEAWEKI